MVNATRTCIPPLWKQDTSPSLSVWFTKINEVYSMENITASLQCKEEKFKGKWFYWTQITCSSEYTSAIQWESEIVPLPLPPSFFPILSPFHF